MKTQIIKIDWKVSDKSWNECVFLKDTNVVTQDVLYFQAAADPEVTSQEDGWPMGSSFHDLIYCMNSSPRPLCLGSSQGSWVDWEPQGTWSASQINIMELIDQPKFSQGTVLEYTHISFLCVTHWDPTLPHSIHTSYLNLSSWVTSDSNDSSFCLILMPFLYSALLLLLGSKDTNSRLETAPVLEMNVK